MPQFTITYNSDRAPEMVEADRVTVVERNGQVVLHREVMVMNRPREIVVRRLSVAEVLSVEETHETATGPRTFRP